MSIDLSMLLKNLCNCTKTEVAFLGFYTIFERLCSEKGVSPAQVRATLGISQSTMASWKSRGLTPKYDTAKKLAQYFGVDVDDLFVETYGIEAGGKIEAGGGIKSRYGIKAGGSVKAGGPIEVGPGVYGEQARANLAMEQMTEEGRGKVADYAEDILPRYRREEAPEPGTPGTDTPSEGKPTEDT